MVLAGSLGDHGVTPEMVIGPEGPEMEKSPSPRIPQFVVGTKQPFEWLVPENDAFISKGQTSEVRFVPLYKIAEGRYSIYWRMS
jgi:hypothetical protein